VDGVGEVKRGPQPYEGIVSVVCEAFGIAPLEAERQDWGLVKAILDYRNAKWAVESFNDLEHGQAIMQRNPHLMELLRDMVRAQLGSADEEEVDATLAGMRPQAATEG
jgi:hypothetical protein